MTTTPRELAVSMRGALAWSPDVDLEQIDDDHTQNDWRAEGTQAVNFHVRLDERDFLVTVEDVTTPEAAAPVCGWFAACGRPATGTTPHPVLGEVPTCDRCARFAAE